MIYFIQCSATLRVKIGYSADPWRRFVKIQSDSPGSLAMLSIIDGGQPEKTALHERFASCKARGEWFEPDGELRRYLAALPPAAQRGGTTRFKWGDSNLLDDDIAKLTGLSRSQVNRIRNRRKDPTFRAALQIIAATGMPITDLGVAL